MPPALIPAAGRGTRLRPVTEYLSKPMLPVGAEPVIHYAIEEAISAGCSPVVIIRSSNDSDLEDYVAKNYGKTIKFAVQNEPRGLADALLEGYRVVDHNGSYAVLLPDNVILNGKGIKSLLDLEIEGCITGTTEVSADHAPFYGNSGGYDGQNLDEYDSVEQIVKLQEKRDGTFEDRYKDWPARRCVPRHVLTEEFFEKAEESEPDPETGEVDDVPILRAMVQSGNLYGAPLDGTPYDMGNPHRYLRLCHAVYEKNICSRNMD